MTATGPNFMRDFSPSMSATWNSASTMLLTNGLRQVGGAELAPVKEWCTANCTGRWSIGHGRTPHGWQLCFYFKSERDQTAFILQWSGAFISHQI